MLGVLLTKWTIRAALALLVAYWAGELACRSPRWPAIGRWIWTAGCGVFLLHVACAFHFYHHWSHAAAWESTAQQTKDLLGVAFGNGIYFSYVFMGLWLADVIWIWSVDAARRTPWPRVLVHGFLLFIAFNGAIVFEGGPTRWAGIAVCLVLAGLAIRTAYNSWRVPRNIPACEIVH